MPTERHLLSWVTQDDGCLIFKEAIFFVPLLLPATCRPFGRTQVLRSIIPGMVTMIIQDPIRVLLYRRVIIMTQGDRTMAEIALYSTTQVVTKATNHITTQVITKETDQMLGRKRIPTPGDLGQVNSNTLLVTINTRRVTRGSSSSSSIIVSKAHLPGMTAAIRTRFPTTATDLTKMANRSLLLKLKLYHRDTTVVQHQEQITMRVVKSMKMSRVFVKLSLWLKTVK